MHFKLNSIHIYPIKSLGGYEVQSSVCLETGLQYDRNWMLADEMGRFISQRETPILSQFATSIMDDVLSVSHAGSNIEIDIKAKGRDYTDVSVWKHNFQGQLIDPKIDDWFSDRIGKKCSLVKMGSESIRKKSLTKKPYKTNLAFADGYPYLILGTSSMNELNNRLEAKIKFDRFRPNLVVETHEPHEEDDWDFLSIGKVAFRNIKPCVRCNMITLDQQTGKFGKEPLKTLAGYRRNGNQILFATNAVCLEKGTIKKGDNLILQ